VIIRWLLFYLFIVINSLNTAYAEDSAQDWFKIREIQNRESELDVERSELELMKMELETERLNMLKKASESEDELNERLEQAEQELNERLEQTQQDLQEKLNEAKEAEEAAYDALSKIEQTDVKHKNQLYLGVFFASIIIFLLRVVRKSKNGSFMKDYEKYGIIIILSSILLILFCLIISAPWEERLDLFQNLMTELKITFYAYDEDCKFNCTYMIDFPSKYAILLLLTTASYGFTTYLGITPAYGIDLLGFIAKDE
jgi:flagellar biosynthesis GTPase FlhF